MQRPKLCGWFPKSETDILSLTFGIYETLTSETILFYQFWCLFKNYNIFVFNNKSLYVCYWTQFFFFFFVSNHTRHVLTAGFLSNMSVMLNGNNFIKSGVPQKVSHYIQQFTHSHSYSHWWWQTTATLG